MEEYLIISNANFLLRVASDNDKWSIVVKGNRQVQGEENQGRGYFQNGSKLATFLKNRQKPAYFLKKSSINTLFSDKSSIFAP